MKHAKKVVALIAAVVLTMGLMVGCGSTNVKEAVIGDWHIESIGGKDLATYAKENNVQENQLQTNYTFKEDGTGFCENVLLTASGVDGSCKWEEKDGKIVMTMNAASSQSSEFTFADDKLSSTVSGVTTILVKGKAEIQSADDLVNGATSDAQ